MTKSLNEGLCKSDANETEELCGDQSLLMVVVIIILVLIVSEAIGVLKAGMEENM